MSLELPLLDVYPPTSVATGQFVPFGATGPFVPCGATTLQRDNLSRVVRQFVSLMSLELPLLDVYPPTS
eukprot:1050832-Prymnesium_polylepis.1